MTQIRNVKSPLIATLLLAGTPALADVSPADVWADWKDQMSNYGYEVSADEAQSGGDLTVSDISMVIPVPEEDATVRVTLPEIGFVDNGDGTVMIKLPAIMPVSFEFEGDDSEEVSGTVDYTTTGLAMTASGDPEALTYTYSAASMGVALGDLVVEGEKLDLGVAKLVLNNVSGSSSSEGTGTKQVKQNFSASELLYDINMADPEGDEGRLMLKGSLSGLTASSNSTLPENVDFNDMMAAMAAGFSVAGEFAYKGGQSEFSFIEEDDSFSGTSSTTSGAFDFVMNAEELLYEATGTGAKLNIQAADLPFPISLAFEETGFALQMPTSETEEPEDFRFAVKLGDFTMSDMIWGMFDPAGQLPRDPATVALDLTGKARMLSNIFDPEEMAEIGDDVPGELHALDVKDLQLTAAGAELTGKGAFTFDNSDLESFDGMPRPEGVLNLALTGGNALLDKLVAMGFVPEEDAMGARMMMGMFTVPGDGPDSLTSKIEVNAEGHVLANGQRLK